LYHKTLKKTQITAIATFKAAVIYLFWKL